MQVDLVKSCYYPDYMYVHWIREGVVVHESLWSKDWFTLGSIQNDLLKDNFLVFNVPREEGRQALIRLLKLGNFSEGN